MELTPEERQNIFDEEKARHEARRKIRDEEEHARAMSELAARQETQRLRARQQWKLIKVVLLVVVLFWTVITAPRIIDEVRVSLRQRSLGSQHQATAQRPTKTVTTPKPHDDLSLFLTQYAPPDSDDTTAYDNPRPPLVTRWLVYERERVRLAYIADAPVGSPPPYDRWKLFGVQDPVTDEVLEFEEALRRLEGRGSK